MSFSSTRRNEITINQNFSNYKEVFNMFLSPLDIEKSPEARISNQYKTLSKMNLSDFYKIDYLKIKGARYRVQIYTQDFDKYQGPQVLAVDYFKMPDVDTREALQDILCQLRAKNPKGEGKIYKNSRDYLTSRDINNVTQLKRDNFQIFFHLGEGFADAIVIEQIILTLLKIKDFNEEDMHAFTGYIDDTKTPTISLILLVNLDIVRTICKALSEPKLIQRKHKEGHDLLLSLNSDSFNVLEKTCPPSYKEATSEQKREISQSEGRVELHYDSKGILDWAKDLFR